ncbi:MAG: penicillin-binding transpeptidase domain-containing protein, partial [bacterium]|nr:penicillin-binding transpeptidase domain-containing protein [bacterium]
FFTRPEAERQELVRALEARLGLSAGHIGERLLAADVEVSDRIVLVEDLDLEDALRLKKEAFPGVLIEEGFRRHYLKGASAAHLLGYTGLATKEDIARDPTLHANDIVGKTGLEAEYDQLLRGEDGTVVALRTAKGEVLEEQEGRKARAGASLRLTVDAEFQEYFARRFAQGLASLGRTSGTGLAINPQNGEILALLSWPSFDSNIFVETKRSEERRAVLGAKTKPLFNRAVSGLYNPASTIKPLHAVAALSQNVVMPTTSVFSGGYIELPNPYDPSRPSRFVDWKPHGWVDVHSALARSSNVYFYTVGGGYGEIKGLGIARLREWWQKFLFGTATGVDLPGEAAGFLPDPEEKERRTGQIWRIGDTYNVSIGQGDILVTPLQLLDYIALIANGGKLYRPHLAMNEKGREEVADLSEYAGAMREVQQGMIDAVQKPYGTANLLAVLPFTVAAKTGSAQTENNAKINAIFVGYAPVGGDAVPEIAVLVLVEDAKEGSLNAVPIAKDVLAWYYENRIKGLARESAP